MYVYRLWSEASGLPGLYANELRAQHIVMTQAGTVKRPHLSRLWLSSAVTTTRSAPVSSSTTMNCL